MKVRTLRLSVSFTEGQMAALLALAHVREQKINKRIPINTLINEAVELLIKESIKIEPQTDGN